MTPFLLRQGYEIIIKIMNWLPFQQFYKSANCRLGNTVRRVPWETACFATSHQNSSLYFLCDPIGNSNIEQCLSESPSILRWNCWHVINETYDDVNLKYQPDIRILRLDQSDFNIMMTSSWYQMLSSIKKFSRIVYQVLRTSPADVLKTSPYGLICNSKGRVLPTSWKCPKDVLI